MKNQKINKTEDGEQEAVIDWCTVSKGKYPELEMIHHVANEGRRSPQYGARLKRMGMSPGYPDLLLDCPKGIYHGLRIELKKDRDSKPTAEQKKWISKLNRYGYYAVVCYGADEAIAVLHQYLNLKENEGMGYDT